MKLRLYILSLLFITHLGKAQQLSQFSQYLDNNYLINPAATDLQNSLKLGIGFRQQWGDVPGNPRTLYLTAYAPLSKLHESQHMRASMRLDGSVNNQGSDGVKPRMSHVLGMTVMNDDFGMFSKNTIHFSYGIHLPLTEKLSISAAPKLGVVNLRLNDGLWVFEDNDQPFEDFVTAYGSETLLDVGFGLWLYSNKFFLGYSLEQLNRNKSTKSGESAGYEFTPHHFFSFGYSFQINHYFKVVPSVMGRYTPLSPINMDYSVRLEYQNRIWVGLSLRKSNAMVGLFGLFINSNIKFNYSFDHGLATGGRDGLNAHEFSFKFNVLQNLYNK